MTEAKTMSFQAALHELGVRPDTLTSDEIQHLDEKGYVLLRDVIDATQAARMRAVSEELLLREKIEDPAECTQMQNKSDAFDVCLKHPRVLAALFHVLRSEFRNMGVNAFPNLPGRKQQAMHVDGDYSTDGEYLTCNSMWPLVNFTEENGATRVVPGSHRNGRKIADDLSDPKASHPDEVRMIAPVGTVIIFNGHLWHGATLNHSDHRRASVTSFWTRRRLPPSWRPMRSDLSPAAAKRLGPAAQQLFDPVT